jgi:hypothetical protein
MAGMIIAIVLTFVLSLALMLVLLNGRSTVEVRLAKIAGTATPESASPRSGVQMTSRVTE